MMRFYKNEVYVRDCIRKLKTGKPFEFLTQYSDVVILSSKMTSIDLKFEHIQMHTRYNMITTRVRLDEQAFLLKHTRTTHFSTKIE